MSHPSRTKGPGFWIAYLAFLLVLAVGTMELGLRLFWLKRLTIGSGIEHPHFHHRLTPNHTYHFSSTEFAVDVRTNRYGLRGPAPVIPKPEGTVRILMLGDSYTFGFPVRDEETFCVLSQQALRAAGFPVDVINGGVSGYSPTLEYVSLRDEFLAFEPDLVILWYDLGDIQEDSWFQKNLVYDAQGGLLRCDPGYINGRWSGMEWMKHRSALAQYLDKKLLRTLEKIRILGLWGYVRTKLRGERAKVAIARLKGEQRSEDLGAYDRFLLVRPTSTVELVRPSWGLSARYLTMIRDLLAERHIPFLLGVYPYGMVVGPDQWGNGRTYWGFEPGKTYEPAVALSLFEEFSREANVPLLNTFKHFREAAGTEKLFYDWDGHFTPAGHRIVAAHLLQDPAFLTVLRQRIGPMPSRKTAAR